MTVGRPIGCLVAPMSPEWGEEAKAPSAVIHIQARSINREEAKAPTAVIHIQARSMNREEAKAPHRYHPHLSEINSTAPARLDAVLAQLGL